MKNYSRKTKAMGDSKWTSNRSDFQAQTAEVYGGMNMQVASMKMPA